MGLGRSPREEQLMSFVNKQPGEKAEAHGENAQGHGGLLTEIDHVAIAVHDLEAAIGWYRDVFGATVAHRETVEAEGV